LILEAKTLTAYYGRAEALRGISFVIERGEIVTLIGSNGAGKSTTLRCISGTKEITKGEIWFEGERIDRKRPHEVVKMGIAHILEGRRLFSTMTVQENLELGAYLQKNKNETANNLDRIFDHFPILKERRKQAAGSLSGGEQQMLATARALMTEPVLLLMDEPSLGLSPLLVLTVANIIREINQQGVSIILVEQNARMALKIATRAYVFELGNIALKGNAKDLLHNEHIRRAYLGS